MFDFLKLWSGSPIDKLVKRVIETAGEDAPRIEALHKLNDMGTPDATFAMARRFTVSSKVMVQDIEEKRMVVEMLAAKGERAVEPILKFLRSYHQVEWPVQALTRILPQEKLIPMLVKVLEDVAQNPFTSPEHRTSLIKAMEGQITPEIAAALSKSLDDDDDDVRIAAVHAVAEVGEDSREKLLDAYVKADDRPRIRIAIAELFSDKGWPVKGFRPTVESTLPDGFLMNAKGIIRRKGAPA